MHIKCTLCSLKFSLHCSPLTKQQEIINRIGPYLSNAQINQMLKTNKLKLTKRQSQDVGFLSLLLGALGSLAAPVLGSLFGKGFQVDAQQRVPQGKGLQVDAEQRVYRRVLRVNKIKKTFTINQCPTLIL